MQTVGPLGGYSDKNQRNPWQAAASRFLSYLSLMLMLLKLLALLCEAHVRTQRLNFSCPPAPWQARMAGANECNPLQSAVRNILGIHMFWTFL